MSFKIESVVDYLKWAKKCHQIDFKRKTFEVHPFYRGLSNMDYTPVPTLHRDGIEDDEVELFQNAQNMLWRETNQLTYIDKLIYFQHYGLKTRLMDITSNPLVALYFACSGVQDKDKDGIVYGGYFHNKKEAINLDKLIEYIVTHKFSGPIHKEELALFQLNHPFLNDLLTQCQIITPPLNNSRIKPQYGAFILAPLFNIDKEDANQYFYKTNFEDTFKNYFKNKVVIPKKNKDKLLIELDEYGINEASIFPDPEHILSYVNWKINKQTFIL